MPNNSLMKSLMNYTTNCPLFMTGVCEPLLARCSFCPRKVVVISVCVCECVCVTVVCVHVCHWCGVHTCRCVRACMYYWCVLCVRVCMCCCGVCVRMCLSLWCVYVCIHVTMVCVCTCAAKVLAVVIRVSSGSPRVLQAQGSRWVCKSHDYISYHTITSYPSF